MPVRHVQQQKWITNLLILALAFNTPGAPGCTQAEEAPTQIPKPSPCRINVRITWCQLSPAEDSPPKSPAGVSKSSQTMQGFVGTAKKGSKTHGGFVRFLTQPLSFSINNGVKISRVSTICHPVLESRFTGHGFL